MSYETTSEQKNKLFLFNLLSKKQKVQNTSNNNHQQQQNKNSSSSISFNSIFKNEHKKLFLDCKIINKLENIDSISVLSGYMKGKTNFNDAKKSYFLLRKYGNEIKNKFLLECYKDSTFKKVKYIIDIDYVDQIDLKETENKIILSRSNEYCILDAGDRRNAFLWVNKICKNCGFDEIKNKNNNNNNSKINNNNQLEIANKKQSKSILNSTNSSNDDSSSEAKNMSITTTTQNNSAANVHKPVAGIAALSVGSFHMKLDNIFKKKPNDQLKKSKSIDNENIKENYVFLQDFMSGLDNNDNNNNNNSRNMFYSINSLNNNENNEKQHLVKPNHIQSSNSLMNNASALFELNSNSFANGYKINNQRTPINKRLNNTNDSNDDRYINYTVKFNDSKDINNNFTNQAVKLRYVPLEIIENPNIYYTKVTSSVADSAIASTKKANDLNKEYTDLDEFRTRALKNTQEQFQFHRNKESLFFDK